MLTLGLGSGLVTPLLLIGLYTGPEDGSPIPGSPGNLRQHWCHDNGGSGALWYDLFAGSTGTIFGGFHKAPAPYDFTLENLVVRLETPPGEGNERVYALNVNGIATGTIITIADTDTEGRALGTVTTLSEGDIVRLQATETGTPEPSARTWVNFEGVGDVDGEHGYAGNFNLLSTGQTRYLDPFEPGLQATTVDGAATPVAEPVTMVSLSLARHLAAGGPGTGLVATVYLSTDDGVTYVAQDGTGGTPNTVTTLVNEAVDDPVAQTFSLELDRGDIFYIQAVVQGTTADWFSCATKFITYTGDYNMSCGGTPTAPQNSQPNYNRLTWIDLAGWTDDEEDAFDHAHYATVTGFSLRDPYAIAEVAPGTSRTRTLVLRRDNVSVPVSVVVTGAATPSVGDGSGTASFVDGETFTVRHTPANSPRTDGDYRWTFIVGIGEVEVESPTPPPQPGGTVGPGINPPPAVIPTGVIRTFVEFLIGTESPYTRLAVAETTLRDPLEWHSGKKKPMLLSVSEIERELTSDGSFRGTDVRVVVADDGTFRTLATTDTLSNAYAAIYVVSDEVRYALGEPYRIFAGRIQEHQALPGFKYEFVIRDIMSNQIANLDASPRIPPARLSLADFPGMSAQYEGRAAPLVIGLCSDELEDGNFDTIPQGVIPPVILGRINFTHWGGIDQNVIACIWSTGAMAIHDDWRVYYNPPDTPDLRILVPLSSWGSDVWTPGMPGWAETGLIVDYVDYPQPLASNTRRYTPFFVSADIPVLAEAFEQQRILAAGNLYGITENPDGTGLYLSDAPRIWQWLLVNQLYFKYQVGAYADIPMLDDTYSILDQDTVEVATERLRSRLGGSSPGEYPVGFALGRDGNQQTLRHVLQELCLGVLMDQGINRHGQLIVDVEDPLAPATVSLSDLHDIEDGQFQVWVDRSSYYNRIEYTYGRRYVPPSAPRATPAEGEPLPTQPVSPYIEWTSGLREMRHEDAIDANQGEERSYILENFVVRATAVANDVAERFLDRAVGPEPAYDGPRMFRLTTSWQGLGVGSDEIELGTVIGITHLEGLGPSGYEGQRGRVMKIRIDPLRARVTLEGRILHGVVSEEGGELLEPVTIAIPAGGLSVAGHVTGPPTIAIPAGSLSITGRTPSDVQSGEGGGEGEVLFANSFESPNDGGTGVYGWDGRYGNASLWSTTHLATGGYDGNGAVQVTVNSGEEQFSIGWWSPNLGHEFTLGDSIFLRFRLKFPNGGLPSANSGFRLKFILLGGVSDGTDNTSRCITYMGVRDTFLEYGTNAYTGSFDTYHFAADYGITGSFDGGYIGLAAQRNIEGARMVAVPPICMTEEDNSNRGTPGYSSTGDWGTYPGAAADDGWYHIQIEIRSGSAGNASIKQWCNHNTYGEPQSEQDPMYYGATATQAGIACGDWDGGITLGAFIDTPSSGDFIYIVDDVEIATAFDASWYPG
jgi:hypothetical protein